MRQLNYAVFLLLAFAVATLSACGAMAPKPKSLDQKLAYAEGQVTAGYTAVADLATRKRISAATGAKMISDLDAISASLKAARIAVGQGNATQAQTLLDSAEALLLKFEQTKKESQ